MESKRGGSRPGAGRKKSADAKKDCIQIRLPNELNTMLDDFVQGTGLTRTQIVENAIWHHLMNYENIVYCPECHTPLAFKDMFPEGEAVLTCKCGYEFTVEL